MEQVVDEGEITSGESRKKEGFYIILDYAECKWRKVKRITKVLDE